jgi:hypothetical protein
MAIWDKQVQAMQLQGGPAGPLVSPKNLYETATKIVHNAGIKTAQGFFSDPSLAPPAPPGPPPVDPAAMELQARVALENRKLDADIALKLRKHEDEMALKRLELGLRFGAPPMGMPEGMTRGLSPGGPARVPPDMPPGASAAEGPASALPLGASTPVAPREHGRPRP